ncbi:glycosyltransferase family 9 protein [Sphaerisporangium rubeum]|uniref:ADP-heptose:LPS heptosyltransferase n=1 Tax=Sphaerisporangium rubeum TaxID=321317 RepID=A0A7X0IKM0_9ACTN|nr:glycosyltransferase family 9 protein [Sphaerisporangium rubeum]MBB6475738.1 ADP-heptose:LPS heptosyltransferase [Sphaerisporangium rubeum]
MTAALVLRAPGVGELLTAVPALRALYAGGLRVVLAVPEELTELADLTGAVRAVLPTRGLDRLAWGGHRPTVAIDMYGPGPESHLRLMDLRPQRLWAFAHPVFPRLKGPPWRDDEHDVERCCRLIEWYGARTDPADLRLPPPPGHPPPASGTALIHPGAADPAYRWPPERFAEVARALVADGMRVVVTGNRRERPLGLLVAGLAGLPPESVLAGRSSLMDLCAAVSGASLLVSAHCGAAHLAPAYGVPSVTVAGGEPSGPWGPPPYLAGNRVLGGDAGVPAVLNAIKQVLSR